MVDRIFLTPDEAIVAKEAWPRFLDWVHGLLTKDDPAEISIEEEQRNFAKAIRWWWGSEDWLNLVYIEPGRYRYWPPSEEWYVLTAKLIVALDRGDPHEIADAHYELALDYYCQALGEFFRDIFECDPRDISIIECRKALSIEPQVAKYRGLIANCYGHTDRPFEAFAECLNMLRVDPTAQYLEYDIWNPLVLRHHGKGQILKLGSAPLV